MAKLRKVRSFSLTNHDLSKGRGKMEISESGAKKMEVLLGRQDKVRQLKQMLRRATRPKDRERLNAQIKWASQKVSELIQQLQW